MSKYTPMLQQYLQIKDQQPDCLLFFRLGDFYEMFFEDAQAAARELEIVLTSRTAVMLDAFLCAGFPITRLILQPSLSLGVIEWPYVNRWKILG